MTENTENSTPKDTTPNAKTALVLPKKRRLRIGAREIRAMAELLVKRLTEAEAARTLGIEPRSWYKWRARKRNEGKFTALLDALTGAKLNAHVENIEAAGIGAGPHKRADWRASKAVLEMMAPARYGPQQAQAPAAPQAIPAPTINLWLGSAYGPHAKVDAPPAAQVDDAQETIDTWTPAILAAGQPAPRLLLPPAEPATRKGKHGPE